MSREKLIDIMDVRANIKSGRLKAEIINGEIILQDTRTHETAKIGAANQETLLTVQELQKKLEQYEKAEQDGRLIISPVAIGQKVYHVFLLRDGTFSHINEETVVGLHLRDDEDGRCTKHGEYMITRKNGYSTRIRLKEIGKTVFLTREAAEATYGIN